MSDNEVRWVTSEDTPWAEQEKQQLRALLRERLTRRQLMKYGSLAGMSLATLWSVACSSGAVPAPTSAPAKPADAKPADAKPAESKPAAAPTTVAAKPAADAKPATAAPTAPAAAAKPTGPQVLRFASAVLGEPKTLDGSLAGADAWVFCRGLFSTLLRYEGADTKLVGDLAKEWSRSADGLSYTFKLRDDVKWHNGYGKFTSADVKAHFERLKDPATQSLWRSDAARITKIETPDDYTVILGMNEPWVAFPHFLTSKMGWIVNAKAAKEMGADYGRKPIGTGFLVFESWSPRQEMVFKRNDEYYGTKPKLEKVQYKIIYEEPTVQLAFEGGELDVWSRIDADNYIRLTADPKYQGFKYVRSVLNVYLNTQHPILKDKRVRQALAMGVNKDELIKGLMKGVPEPAKSAMPSYTWGYDPNIPQIPYDPDRAKALLKEAGYEKGFPLALTTTTGIFQQNMQVVQEQWTKIGIDAKIDLVDTVTVGAKWRNGQTEARITHQIRPPDPDAYFWDVYHKSMFDPEKSMFTGIDALLEQGRVELDDNKRKEIYSKVQRILVEEAQAIPLYEFPLLYVARKPVQGFLVTPDHDMTIGFEYIWMES